MKLRIEEPLPSDLLKKGWVQLKYAVDKDGAMVRIGSEEATKWCLSGALFSCPTLANLVENEDELSPSLVLTDLGQEYQDTLRRLCPLGNWPTKWNDDERRTQAEVVALAEEVEQALGLRAC